MSDSMESAPPSSSSATRRDACMYYASVAFMVIVAVGCCLVYRFGSIKRIFHIFYLTGYGIMSIVYYISTSFFAVMNKRLVDKKSSASEDELIERAPSVGVHVVGYREDPGYFRSCLESVLAMDYSNVKVISVVIDGNEEDDMYMVNIAEQVFGPNSCVINLPDDPRVNNRYEDMLGDAESVRVPASSPTGTTESGTTGTGLPKVYIVSQPHRGKREVIYTAYKISERVGVEFFLNTDSDTIINPTALREMVRMTQGAPDVGAVAGELTIFNANNWLSKLSAGRYIIAFNIERASQSYHGVLNCISGPLGLYRMEVVSGIVDTWVDQSFIGKKCTFGDDRNMTNMMLSTRHKVLYTHRATAATETPTSYKRFIAQQTRWTKSFWREMLLQTGWVFNHWYMMLEMVYNVLFPTLIAFTILTVIYTREWTSHLAILIVTIVLPLFRCTLVYLVYGCSPVVFMGVLYPMLYFTSLLPLKFVALFTVNNTAWGTSSRLNVVNDFAPVIPIIIWNVILMVGVVLHIIRDM